MAHFGEMIVATLLMGQKKELGIHLILRRCQLTSKDCIFKFNCKLSMFFIFQASNMSTGPGDARVCAYMPVYDQHGCTHLHNYLDNRPEQVMYVT